MCRFCLLLILHKLDPEFVIRTAEMFTGKVRGDKYISYHSRDILCSWLDGMSPRVPFIEVFMFRMILVYVLIKLVEIRSLFVMHVSPIISL